ncbi:hypothetical protein H6G97_45010 [Nostoc flagelliforme FACHB-838]|uniref:RNA polymerase sigma-70 region 4 domain-containing protein n=1 Tax=Nostoc flagelliforme FACHB-838 TaxID=2692904 RepID=A0ABR8E672_9NOSO|nr:hypothetical protein [Nostoc flagelliforme FACHB-838]
MRQMLTLSFGLENDQHFNPAQIGQQLNLSRERIRQMMHGSCITKTKNYIKEVSPQQ